MRLVVRAWRMTKQEGRWADYKEATSSLEPAVLTINPGRIYLATDQSTLGVFHRKGPENPPHTQRLEPFPRCAGIGSGVRVPLCCARELPRLLGPGRAPHCRRASRPSMRWSSCRQYPRRDPSSAYVPSSLDPQLLWTLVAQIMSTTSTLG